jgi:hypothetical protein
MAAVEDILSLIGDNLELLLLAKWHQRSTAMKRESLAWILMTFCPHPGGPTILDK